MRGKGLKTQEKNLQSLEKNILENCSSCIYLGKQDNWCKWGFWNSQKKSVKKRKKCLKVEKKFLQLKKKYLHRKKIPRK